MMSKNIPLIIQRMLERPPILVDEDRADYNDLFEMLCEDERPQTMEEWILVADIAYADWEVFRLRGLKVRGFHAVLPRVLLKEIDVGVQNKHIDCMTGTSQPKWLREFRGLVTGVLAGNADARSAMTKLLASHGLTVESLLGATFAATMSTQLSADRLVDAAYRRRSALYSDLERARNRRSRDLPTAADSPSVAPSDGAGNAPIAAPEDAGGHGADDQPSSADGGHP
jgi:hypothetical protein